MARPRFLSALQNKIQNGQKKTGQIILTYDSQRMFWDVDDNTRIEIADIIELPNENTRISLLNPNGKFYYVVETNSLWKFKNDVWLQVNSPPPEYYAKLKLVEEENLPILSLGEFALCKDSNKVFIGTNIGNVQLLTNLTNMNVTVPAIEDTTIGGDKTYSIDIN